ncbi:MAG: threonine/serine dehydratase [Candidatus Heimdallarchaeota archaeon]|nr:MAG: threonine/serine dehydratase [Candidatus Heimdallarchaeota archaeon]
MVNLQDIYLAKKIIANHVIHTPLISSTNLDRLKDMNLHFKAEIFQRIGSFKLRGVLNKFHNLTEEEKKRGVITISAGNHAQSLAYAASQLGIQAVVIMPYYAAKNKIEATKSYGAEVIMHENSKGLMDRCHELMEERELTLVHPFDDPDIIAGQGTIGLEILEDITEVPDVVVVPVGGGGLISGIASAIKLKNPEIKVIGVEPVGANAMYQSLRKNSVVSLNKIDTIADGLAAPFTGKYTLAHVKKYVDNIVLVSDEEILEALWLLLIQEKILTEPAGAAGFAALLTKKIEVPQSAQIVCVLSGGNINTNLLKTILVENKYYR